MFILYYTLGNVSANYVFLDLMVYKCNAPFGTTECTLEEETCLARRFYVSAE